MKAHPIHDPVDPCQLCGNSSFNTVFVLDAKRPPHVSKRGVKMVGDLCAARSCTECGTWSNATTVRAAATRVINPIRPEVVASLRMKARIYS